MENNEQKQSKVVVIPEAILQDKRFNPAAKLVYARISFFDEFWESSEKTAEYLGLKKYTVQEAKRTLECCGAIIETQNTGRGKRYMTCSKIGELLLKKDLSEDDRQRLKKLSEICRARANHEPRGKVKTSGETNSDVKMDESLEIPNSELAYGELRVRESLDIGKKEVRKREDISLSKDKEEQAPKTSEVIKQDKRNPLIQDLMNEWETIMGEKITSRVQYNRYACNRLIKNKQIGFDKTKEAICYARKALGVQFAPQIRSFEELEQKWSKLQSWIERSFSQQKGVNGDSIPLAFEDIDWESAEHPSGL